MSFPAHLKPLLSFGAIFLFSASSAQALSFSERVRALDSNHSARLVVVERSSERNPVLIRYKGPCIGFDAAQTATLDIDRELDSEGDTLRFGENEACPISRAESFNARMKVASVNLSGKTGILQDEGKRQYRISLNSECSALRAYLGQSIYARLYGSELREYDELFLPRVDQRCVVQSAQWVAPESLGDQAPATSSAVDQKRPAQVARVRAVPGNGSATVLWNAAKDEEGIDHYILSYSPYQLKPEKDENLSSMPNRIVTRNRTLKIEGLNNEWEYFFYVLAVDKAGNQSSNWSDPAMAVPRSAIFRVGKAPLQLPLRIRKTEQNQDSIALSWRDPNGKRQTLTLLEKGAKEVEWASTESWKGNIRFVSSPARKGKTYVFTVRQTDIHGYTERDSFTFRFP